MRKVWLSILCIKVKSGKLSEIKNQCLLKFRFLTINIRCGSMQLPKITGKTRK